MKRTKHKYHYAIRNIKKRERELRMSKIAEAMMDNGDIRNFWYEDKGSSKSYPPHVNDATENGQMADVFSQKYNALYNSVPSDIEEIMMIMSI